MASIARTAGVSTGLLHYHFDTKEQLFGEVLTYSHAVSAELNQHALANAGESPAERLSSFLDRCLPSDHQRADEWLLWQELALLCIRDPHLAKVSAELYEDLYGTVADIVRDGRGGRSLRHRARSAVRWPRRRSPSPTGSAPGCWRGSRASGSTRRAPRSPPRSASWSGTTGRYRPRRPSKAGAEA